MLNKKSPDSEDILVLDENEQEVEARKSAELIKTWEEKTASPEKEAVIEYPDLSKVRETLAEQGLELLEEREILSGGAFGRIFRLKVKDIKSGEEKYIVERSFVRNRGISRRYSVVPVGELNVVDSEPRYKVLDKKSHSEGSLVIDYLYNESLALKDLNGTVGVPKFAGAVDEGQVGSILEEFVDGYDLWDLVSGNKKVGYSQVIKILEQLKAVYTAAAEKGYIHNNPAGMTVMIDSRTNQPYLTDWYLYSRGSIKSGNGPIYEKYLSGLAAIGELQKMLLE